MADGGCRDCGGPAHGSAAVEQSTWSRWFLSILGLVLLILVVAEPGRINPPTRRIRVTTRFLLVLLALSAIVTTMLLIHELVVGNDLSKSATRLLLVGNAVWIANNIVFALLYWEFDGGGLPLVHATRPSTRTWPSSNT